MLAIASFERQGSSRNPTPKLVPGRCIGGLNSKRNHIPSSQSQRRANDLTSNYSAISLNQRARAADPRSFRRNNHQSLDDQAGARFAQLSTELALSQARRTSPPSTALLLCSTYACTPSASAGTNREQQVSGWVTAARHLCWHQSSSHHAPENAAAQ